MQLAIAELSGDDHVEVMVLLRMAGKNKTKQERPKRRTTVIIIPGPIILGRPPHGIPVGTKRLASG